MGSLSFEFKVFMYRHKNATFYNMPRTELLKAEAGYWLIKQMIDKAFETYLESENVFFAKLKK